VIFAVTALAATVVFQQIYFMRQINNLLKKLLDRWSFAETPPVRQTIPKPQAIEEPDMLDETMGSLEGIF